MFIRVVIQCSSKEKVAVGGKLKYHFCFRCRICRIHHKISNYIDISYKPRRPSYKSQKFTSKSSEFFQVCLCSLPTYDWYVCWSQNSSYIEWNFFVSNLICFFEYITSFIPIFELGFPRIYFIFPLVPSLCRLQPILWDLQRFWLIFQKWIEVQK